MSLVHQSCPRHKLGPSSRLSPPQRPLDLSYEFFYISKMNYQNSKTRKNTALQGWSNSLLSYEKDIFQIEKLFF